MAKRKAAKTQPVAPERDKREGGAGGKATNPSVDPMVALAEQLGSFLGRVQKKADGWLENDALRAQVSQIRDGAAELLEQVNRARGAAVRTSNAKLAPPRRDRREGDAAAKKTQKKGRSAGMLDAPVKRLRKPPPQELFDPRLGEPMGKQMGQKNLRRRGGRG